MTIPIYCLSFRNSARRERILRRMDQVGLTCHFVADPLTPMDVDAMVAAKTPAGPPGFESRTAAVMLSHLQMIRTFLDTTGASHGVFCEDDIYLRKTIRNDLPLNATEFDNRELDVLLLGYLWPWREIATPYRFDDYDSDLWGTQMYMLSRKQAASLVETYTLDYALAHAPAPFSSDWIITKVGRRQRIYPMLAVEEGAVETTHAGQIDFHRRCAAAQYDPSAYV